LKIGIEDYRLSCGLKRSWPVRRCSGAIVSWRLSGSPFAALRAFRRLPKLDAAARACCSSRPNNQCCPSTSAYCVWLFYGVGAFDRGSARSVRQALTTRLGQDLEAFRRTFVYFEHHGAATCTERDPHCAICPLLADCPEDRKRSVQ
jgi:hypothetical protein